MTSTCLVCQRRLLTAFVGKPVVGTRTGSTFLPNIRSVTTKAKGASASAATRRISRKSSGSDDEGRARRVGSSFQNRNEGLPAGTRPRRSRSPRSESTPSSRNSRKSSTTTRAKPLRKGSAAAKEAKITRNLTSIITEEGDVVFVKKSRDPVKRAERKARRDAERRGPDSDDIHLNPIIGEFSTRTDPTAAVLKQKVNFVNPRPPRNTDPTDALSMQSTTDDPIDPRLNKKPLSWQIQKAALDKKFASQGGWNPLKKLSPDTIEGIRAMHTSDPAKYTTPVLAESFEVSPEVIRRILRGKWKPTPEEAERRAGAWNRRGEKIFDRLVEKGLRSPKKYKAGGVGRANMTEDEIKREERRKRLNQFYKERSQGGDEGPSPRPANAFGGRDTPERGSPRSFRASGPSERRSQTSSAPSESSRSSMTVSETIASALAMSKGQAGQTRGVARHTL